MIHINDKEVNKISKWDLLHDIINPPKRAKILNIHYSPILHGCMNTRKCRAKFKSIRILLDGGCSYNMLMGGLVEKLYPEKDAVMQRHTQAGNVTANIKVKTNFILPALSSMNIVTWKFHINDSNKGRYDMILRRDLLT